MAGLFNSTTVFNSLKTRFLCILSCSQYNKDTILKAIHNIKAAVPILVYVVLNITKIQF